MPIEIRVGKFGANKRLEGVGLYIDGKPVVWKELEALRKEPIRLTITGE